MGDGAGLVGNYSIVGAPPCWPVPRRQLGQEERFSVILNPGSGNCYCALLGVHPGCGGVQWAPNW